MLKVEGAFYYFPDTILHIITRNDLDGMIHKILFCDHRGFIRLESTDSY